MTVRIPFRLQVHMNLADALSEITIANGYQTDIGPNVFRGRTRFGSNDPLPALSILEPPIALDLDRSPFDSPKDKGLWQLLVQGFLPDDQKNPTDPAHMLMADVKQRLAIEKQRKLNGLDRLNPFNLGMDISPKNHILGIQSIGSGVVRPPDEYVSDKAYFWLPLTLQIYEDLNDPFV